MNGLNVSNNSGSSYLINTYANVRKSLPIGLSLGCSQQIVARSNNDGEKWAYSQYGSLFSGNGHDLPSVTLSPPRHRPPCAKFSDHFGAGVHRLNCLNAIALRCRPPPLRQISMQRGHLAHPAFGATDPGIEWPSDYQTRPTIVKNAKDVLQPRFNAGGCGGKLTTCHGPSAS